MRRGIGKRIEQLANMGRLFSLPGWFEMGYQGPPQFGVWLGDWTVWDSEEGPDGSVTEKLTATVYVDGRPYKECLIYEIWSEEGELQEWWVEELRDL